MGEGGYKGGFFAGLCGRFGWCWEGGVRRWIEWDWALRGGLCLDIYVRAEGGIRRETYVRSCGLESQLWVRRLACDCV